MCQSQQCKKKEKMACCCGLGSLCQSLHCLHSQNICISLLNLLANFGQDDAYNAQHLLGSVSCNNSYLSVELSHQTFEQTMPLYGALVSIVWFICIHCMHGAVHWCLCIIIAWWKDVVWCIGLVHWLSMVHWCYMVHRHPWSGALASIVWYIDVIWRIGGMVNWHSMVHWHHMLQHWHCMVNQHPSYGAIGIHCMVYEHGIVNLIGMVNWHSMVHRHHMVQQHLLYGAWASATWCIGIHHMVHWGPLYSALASIVWWNSSHCMVHWCTLYGILA